MKTLTIILATALTLTMNIAMANGKECKSDCTVYTDLYSLRPEVPGVADFQETSEDATWIALTLTPTVPREADFSDEIMEGQADLAAFTPQLPTTADFE